MGTSPALPECFRLIRGFAPGIELAPLLAQTWEQRSLRMFGREVKVPRLTRWFGERGYTYSGIDNAPAPMPEWLNGLRARIETASGARFNSALLNYYRDGRDSVAWHADDEKELGPRPTIASLSLGASRVFAIRAHGGPVERVALEDGDLLIMSGDSQSGYQHAVPKTAAAVGPRVNITLRWIE